MSDAVCKTPGRNEQSLGLHRTKPALGKIKRAEKPNDIKTDVTTSIDKLNAADLRARARRLDREVISY
jgi:hypothetical protein